MFPRRLTSAPRFFVLLFVVHIIPPNSSESYVIFYSGPAEWGETRASPIHQIGPRLFRLSLRVSPVAQHVPAGTVRKARDSLEEVELGRFPHRHTPQGGPRLRSQTLEEEAVGPLFAAADQ